ncbi:hypothetical protein LX36DRAFT_112036 [Colletotrichum falcatum]|nr:hypothetical protein LX36DRAFT_112036 [Colletotrichum falcatum]
MLSKQAGAPMGGELHDVISINATRDSRRGNIPVIPHELHVGMPIAESSMARLTRFGWMACTPGSPPSAGRWTSPICPYSCTSPDMSLFLAPYSRPRRCLESQATGYMRSQAPGSQNHPSSGSGCGWEACHTPMPKPLLIIVGTGRSPSIDTYGYSVLLPRMVYRLSCHNRQQTLHYFPLWHRIRAGPRRPARAAPPPPPPPPPRPRCPGQRNI